MEDARIKGFQRTSNHCRATQLRASDLLFRKLSGSKICPQNVSVRMVSNFSLKNRFLLHRSCCVNFPPPWPLVCTHALFFSHEFFSKFSYFVIYSGVGWGSVSHPLNVDNPEISDVKFLLSWFFFLAWFLLEILFFVFFAGDSPGSVAHLHNPFRYKRPFENGQNCTFSLLPCLFFSRFSFFVIYLGVGWGSASHPLNVDNIEISDIKFFSRPFFSG